MAPNRPALLCVVLLCAGTVALLLARASRRAAPGVSACRLPDGSALMLAATTYGRRHRFRVPPSGYPFATRVRMALSGSSFTYETNTDALVLWFTANAPAPPSNAPTVGSPPQTHPHGYSVRDQHGCVVDERTGVIHFSLAGTRRVYAAVLSWYPQSGESFVLRLFDHRRQPIGEMTIFNPPAVSRKPLVPAPLPITCAAGDLSVTLESVKTQRPTGPSAVRHPCRVAAVFRVSKAGRPTADWQPQADGMSLSDTQGNTLVPKGLSGCVPGAVEFDGLCPFERAWKLRASFTPAGRLSPDSGPALVVPKIPMPKAWETRALSAKRTLEGAWVSLITVCGPGQYQYVAQCPFAAGTPGTPLPSARNWFIGEGPSPDFEVRAPWPHLALSALNLPAGRHLAVRVVDDRGREVQQVASWRADTVYVYLLRPEPGARSLSITVALRAGREVEFVFAPPKP